MYNGNRFFQIGSQAPATTAINDSFLLARVLWWLGISLALTAGGVYLYTGLGIQFPMFMAIIAVFALMFAVQWAVRSRQHQLGVVFLSALAVCEGLFLGPIIALYLAFEPQAVLTSFVAVVGVFFLAGGIVWSTSYSFARWGKWLLIALVIGVIGMVAAFFLPINTYLLSLFLGAVFLGLTLFDFWRIRSHQAVNNDSLLLALSLYLDFINLFLIILRLTGGGGGGQRR